MQPGFIASRCSIDSQAGFEAKPTNIPSVLSVHWTLPTLFPGSLPSYLVVGLLKSTLPRIDHTEVPSCQ